jgi:hypothetical protein
MHASTVGHRQPLDRAEYAMVIDGIDIVDHIGRDRVAATNMFVSNATRMGPGSLMLPLAAKLTSLPRCTL